MGVIGDHSSKQYDQELETMCSRILQMGGLVESQLRIALQAFHEANLDLADRAIQADRRVNELEMELDRLVNHVIARRQPTAGDLRLVMGVGKAIVDIERIGDEATKIARAAKAQREKAVEFHLNRIPDLGESGAVVHEMLRRSLDAFARLDVRAAATIIRDDDGVNERFRAILRQLVTFMMEDQRSISAAIDTVFVAKAIERIGDHSKGIAEQVIFIAQGADVRHATPDEVDRTLSQGG